MHVLYYNIYGGFRRYGEYSSDGVGRGRTGDNGIVFPMGTEFNETLFRYTII